MAALIAVAFLAGLVVRGLAAPHSGSRSDNGSASSKTAAAPAGPGPAVLVDGIASGFGRSKEGASAAAANYVLTGTRLLELAPTRASEAVRSMAATGSADAQVADAERQLHELRAKLADGAGSTHYLQAVLATRVDAFTADRSRVSVWSVGVLSRAKVAEPQAGWTISTFDLVWERGDWKIWSESVTAGPAPALNATAPATAQQFDQALLGFTPWRPAR
jgi:hypothetical protein